LSVWQTPTRSGTAGRLPTLMRPPLWSLIDNCARRRPTVNHTAPRNIIGGCEDHPHLFRHLLKYELQPTITAMGRAQSACRPGRPPSQAINDRPTCASASCEVRTRNAAGTYQPPSDRTTRLRRRTKNRVRERANISRTDQRLFGFCSLLRCGLGPIQRFISRKPLRRNNLRITARPGQRHAMKKSRC
jgi:hypothetical protein